MEFDALLDQEKYQHFMKTEPRQADGPVEMDEQGRRFQYWSIGMVRNAKDGNRTTQKVFLDPVPHILIDNSKPLQGWYKNKFEPKGVRPRPCYTDAILTEPYGGTCPVRCGFCYINSGTRGYRGQGLSTVPIGYGEFVRKSLAKMKTSAAGYFSSFIDPFLPLEEIYHNTQEGATAFVDAGLPIFFLSRMLYPDWAYDLLKRNKYSYAQMSINCPTEYQWRRLSPWAPKFSDMLAQVRSLHKAGIYISIQVNPIIPGVVTNEDIVKLIHMLAKAGANHLIFKFCEIAFPSKNAFIEIFERQFGREAGDTLRGLMTCAIGGQMTIDETYRLDALNLFSRECKKARVTMATCYEYKFERDSVGRILNKTGVSVGGEYLTADQCHGHRVPMFTRESLAAPFREVAECPPSGCLVCGSESKDSRGKCGSTIWGQASAHRTPDYKRSVYDPVEAPPLEEVPSPFKILGPRLW